MPALLEEEAWTKTLLGWIPKDDLQSAAELGGENAKLTGLLRQFLPPGSRLHVLGAGNGTSENSSVHHEAFGADGTLPLESESQDLIFSAFCLERFRMDHLYMALSEARRVVKYEKFAAFLSLAPGLGRWGKLLDRWREARYGEKPLRLDHYLSPEDWETVREEHAVARGRRVQILLLRRVRLPGPSAAES